MKRAALLLLLSVFLIAGDTIYRPEPAIPEPHNKALDGDNDGDTDYIVCSDFDNDQTLEMADIQACIDSITATDGSTVRVLTGSYSVPAAPYTHPNYGGAGDVEWGLVEPKQAMRIVCDKGAVLNGLGSEHIDLDDQGAVVYIAEDDTQLIGCEIDGGFALDLDSDDECGNGTQACANGTRMGVFVNGAERAVVENNYVHNTSHSCLYFRNAPSINIRGNQVDLCGGAWDADGVAGAVPFITQPCAYGYAEDAAACPTAGRTSGMVIADNNFRRCGGAGINFRKEEQCDVLENISMSGNVVTDNVDQVGTYHACLRSRSAWNLSGDITCSGTSGVDFPEADAYWDETNGENGNRNVNITVHMEKTYDTTAALNIGGYQDGITVSGTIADSGSGTLDSDLTRGVLVSGSVPSRRIKLHDLEVIRSEVTGIEIAGEFDDYDEQIILDGVQVIDVDVISPGSAPGYPCILVSADVVGGIFRDLLLRGCSLNAMQWTGQSTSSTFSNIRLDGFPTGYQRNAAINVSALPGKESSCTQGEAYLVDDANGVQECDTGTGALVTVCVCEDAATGDYEPWPGSQNNHAIEFEDASGSDFNHFSGIHLNEGFGGYAIYMAGENVNQGNYVDGVSVVNPSGSSVWTGHRGEGAASFDETATPALNAIGDTFCESGTTGTCEVLDR